ncbi:hypothetical protein WQ82_25480 [Escherichia coli]|nr:hypothetical protein WQ82_25480 [Escherichia coli]
MVSAPAPRHARRRSHRVSRDYRPCPSAGFCSPEYSAVPSPDLPPVPHQWHQSRSSSAWI